MRPDPIATSRQGTLPLRAALVALAFAALPAAAQRAPSSADLAAFDAYVAAAVADWKVPGLAIALVHGDSVVFAKGYGVRTLGEPGAVDAGTRFAIGSTTKAMTAVALGMLVDEGRVRWDAPVIDYLPGFRVADPYVTRELTVRDLLTHRGGLGNADQLWSATDYAPDEIVRRAATLEPAYSLRSGFIYQNIMYHVAGEVVEAVSGMSWADFMRRRIFEPLGMDGTEPTLAAVAGQPNVATPHMEIGDALRPIRNRSVDAVAAAGSVWSGVGDMAKWMRFMLDSARVGGRPLLRPETWQELLTPQTIAARMYPTLSIVRPHFFTYGLGWFLHDYAGDAVAMHTGSIDGMSALIGLIPDRGVGVYVLANLDHAELRHALMYRAFDLFAGRAPRDWSAEFRALYGGLAEQAVSARLEQERRRIAGTSPSLPLERFAGTYEHPTYGRAVVKLVDGALHFTFGTGRSGALEHWHYDTFRARWEDVRLQPSLVTFRTDGHGGVTGVQAFGLDFGRAAESREGRTP